jgi:hypothetical protein
MAAALLWPRSDQAAVRLEHEFGAIERYPGALATNTQRFSRNYDIGYSANASDERLVAHYDEALRQAGWRLVVRSTDGTASCYEKGDLTFTLSFEPSSVTPRPYRVRASGGQGGCATR